MPSNAKAPGRKTPQRRRRNRAHGAVDRLPEEVQLQIKDWYLGGDTYKDISEKLAELGHEINLKQVFRWISRKRDELERIEVARERAQVLAKHLVPDGTDVEGAAVSLAGALCLEALADADLQCVKSIEDLAKVAHSLGRLQSSAVAREKWEHEKRKTIEAAVDRLKADVRGMVANDERLMDELVTLIEQAEQTMLEKTG